MNHLCIGYLSPQYAESLREFGLPRLLPLSGGWVLQRNIPGSVEFDAMGCYPLFSCRDWNHLAEDLTELENEVVCLSVVPEPFDDFREDVLRKAFPDKLVVLKQRFVVDLTKTPETFVSKHHQYYARKALRVITVEVVTPIRLEFDYWNLVPGTVLNLSIFVMSHEGVCVFNTGPVDEKVWHGKPFPGGLFRSVVHIPGNFLNEGSYRVSVMAVIDMSRGLFKRDDVICFDIKDFGPRTGWFGKFPGVVRPKLTWETHFLGDSMNGVGHIEDGAEYNEKPCFS